MLNDPKVPGNFHYELRSPEEEAQLRDLIRDGYARSVRAWGSEAAFKQQLCGRGDYIDLPVLSEERARVCGK